MPKGWKRLEVESAKVVLEGNRTFLVVTTTTPTAGWQVALRTKPADDVRVREYVLAGKPPEGAAAQVITPVTVRQPLEADENAMTVIVTGKDDSSRIAEIPTPPDDSSS